MPKVKNVEKRIEDVEGFAIRIHQRDGRDANDNTKIEPKYHFRKAAPGNFSVKKWTSNRFKCLYTGFDAVVLNGEGEECPGKMMLKNVRATYSNN